MDEPFIIEQAEAYVMRSALRAVLAVERDLGPWDVRVYPRVYMNRVTELCYGGSEVKFTARGVDYHYRIKFPDASDFRSMHLQALMVTR